MKRRTATAQVEREADPPPPRPHGRVMSGKYLLLHKYLDNRYANTVVLTFAEIQDLLGFTLPEQARVRKEWWTNPETDMSAPNYSDSWVLASRTAKPNLSAQTVVFERAS
jgi:hypothetical protein